MLELYGPIGRVHNGDLWCIHILQTCLLQIICHTFEFLENFVYFLIVLGNINVHCNVHLTKVKEIISGALQVVEIIESQISNFF